MKTDDGQGNVVLTNKHEPTEPVTPEPKKSGKNVGILPSTGTTISLKKRKNKRKAWLILSN